MDQFEKMGRTLEKADVDADVYITADPKSSSAAQIMSAASMCDLRDE